jgi:hypothetical protein
MANKAISQELSKDNKLNASNFPIWKHWIRPILFQDKDDYIINVDVPFPPPEC